MNQVVFLSGKIREIRKLVDDLEEFLKSCTGEPSMTMCWYFDDLVEEIDLMIKDAQKSIDDNRFYALSEISIALEFERMRVFGDVGLCVKMNCKRHP